jgi:hypothetical protein
LKKLAILLLVTFSACSGLFRSDSNDRVVAVADDKKLMLSELADRIPNGLSERDSITMAENYINKWVQNEILIHKAKENLKSEEQDFSQQLDEYRNSLLLYTLEQKLVNQYLDTVVTDDEITSYFSQNRSQFELKGNIVKFDFIKLNKRSRYLREFRNLLKSSAPDNVMKLSAYAEKNATDYWFATEWVSFSELLKEMPLEVDNQALFLRRTQYAETEDDEFIYLLRINDYKTADSTSPVEFEKEKIRNIILNARKIELIDRKRKEFIDEAFKNDKAKIY